MNTMTSTKIVGGLCGALLVFLLLNWAAESIFHIGAAEHGAGGEEIETAYAIETGGEEEAGSEVAAGPALAELLPAANIENGEKIFGKCKGCHKIDGGENTGPHLNGVVGRDVGAVAGFGYSDAMLAKEGAWTPEELFAFVAAPKAYLKGTKMGFAGVKDAQDRADLVAYLQTLP
jgi:cytochrome c